MPIGTAISGVYDLKKRGLKQKLALCPILGTQTLGGGPFALEFGLGVDSTWDHCSVMCFSDQILFYCFPMCLFKLSGLHYYHHHFHLKTGRSSVNLALYSTTGIPKTRHSSCSLDAVASTLSHRGGTLDLPKLDPLGRIHIYTLDREPSVEASSSDTFPNVGRSAYLDPRRKDFP